VETIKTTADHIIVKKRSGRYGVRLKTSRAWVNGEDKVKVLLAEGLIKLAEPKPKAEEAEGEAEGGEASETSE
jgi:hypothetical protein